MEDKSIRILVVEDDDAVANIIKSSIAAGFRNTPIQVQEVPSCAQAISLITTQPFDLFLFDYRLEDGDGLSLLKDVRARNITTPVIFLTGYGDEELAEKALRSGATVYMVKLQFSTDSLCHTIRKTLEARGTHITPDTSLQRSPLRKSPPVAKPKALAIADQEGNIISLNHSAETLLSVTEDDLLGHPLSSILCEEDQDRFDTVLDQLVSQEAQVGISQTLQVKAKDQTGLLIPVSVSLSGWKAEDQLYVSAVFQKAV